MHKHMHEHQLTREDSEEEYTQNTHIHTQAGTFPLTGLSAGPGVAFWAGEALAPYWTGDLAEGSQAHSHYSSFSPLCTLN